MNYTNDNINKDWGMYYFKLGILLFFGLWFLVACMTNTIDFLNSVDVTNQWKFNSGNNFALKKVTHIYNTSIIVLNCLFISDILVQGLSAILFFLASFRYVKKKNAWPYINMAFFMSIGLWAIFLIMEEIFIAYSYEPTQIRLLILEVISYAFILDLGM